MNFDKLLERIQNRLCRLGMIKAATWDFALRQKEPMLYAGEIRSDLPQYKSHFGITPFVSSPRNIRHDLRNPFPIKNDSVSRFQSEDVFEHIPYADLPPVIEEIYRVLKPSSLFRLNLPDYRCPVMLDRSVKDSDGKPIFDPEGGGDFKDGKVVNGGHVWFPTLEIIKPLLEQSSFGRRGRISYLHFTDADGKSVLNPIDYSLGHIMRTPDHDDRARPGSHAMSIVVDAWKA